MTRTLRITDTICGECFTAYDTVEEAAECEREDIADAEAEDAALDADDEWAALTAAEEQRFWETQSDYLTSLHGLG